MFKKNLSVLVFLLLLSSNFLMFSDAKEASDYLKQAQEFVNKKDYTNAEKFFILATEALPKSGFHSAQLAQFYYLRTKEHKKAIICYKNAVDKGCHNGWVFIQCYEAYTKLGQFEDGEEWLKTGISILSDKINDINTKMDAAKKSNDREKFRKQVVGCYTDLCKLYVTYSDFESSIKSGESALELSKPDDNINIAESYSKALYYRSLEFLKEKSFVDAHKLMQDAVDAVKTDPNLTKKMLAEYELLESLFEKLISNKLKKPEYTHKILIVLADESNVNMEVDGERFEFNEKLYKTHIYHTEIAAAFTKYFIEAASDGRFGIEYTIERPGINVDKADWTKTTSNKLDTWGLIPDHNSLTQNYPDYFRKKLQNYDTILIVWTIPEFNNANGRSVMFNVEGIEKSVKRGYIHIPSNRMTLNGPDLMLHEFFHVIENMAGISPEHGYYPENRHYFPNWKGENGNDYYSWHLSKYIPENLSKRGKDFSLLNYLVEYPFSE